MRAWFQCVLFHGFDVGFLDFGIVGRFDERQRMMVTDYVIAFATADYRTLARVIIEMGSVAGHIDQEAFARDLEKTYSPLLKLSFPSSRPPRRP